MSVTSEEMKIFADDWQKNALANIASLEFAPSSNTYVGRQTRHLPYHFSTCTSQQPELRIA
jgi:hypothetical protein